MMESAMRVPALTVGLVLGAGFISTIGPMITPANAKAACPCHCPDDHRARPRHAEAPHPAPSHRLIRRYAETGYYNYRAAAPIYRRAWHGAWRVAPNDAYLPGPAPMATAYYPPPGYVEPQGLVIDPRGWNGGVGNDGEGGGGGGYGQVLLTQGANSQNGPSYNSYGESFQENPSTPRPFQSRLMGGVAPASSGSGSK
jgi:hypothetical protein